MAYSTRVSPEKVSQPSCKPPIEILKKIPLFQSLSDAELSLAEPYFHETSYDKETVIFYERDISTKIYFVTQGCVKLVKYSSDGEGAIVRLCSVGEFLGVTGALTGKPMPFSAEALTDSKVYWITQDNFVNLIHQFPKLALNMIVELGQVLWFGYETHSQVVKKTQARVCKIILYHYERESYQLTPEGDRQLNIQLPHDYIASMTGIAYEESVRIISRLKKQESCIQYLRGGKIIITDFEKLKALACDDVDSVRI
jgi:CRP-like cAMP-binding protein